MAGRSSAANDCYLFRSMTGEPRYLVTGPYDRSLYRGLDYLTGLRGVVERWGLRCLPERVLRVENLPDPMVATGATELIDVIGAEASSLSLITSYYKDTLLVGPSRTGEERRFHKVFKRPEDAEDEVTRVAAMRSYCIEAGLAVASASRAGRVVSYPLLRRAGHVSRSERLTKGLALGEVLVARSAVEGVLHPVSEPDGIEEDLRSLLPAGEALALVRAVRRHWTGLNSMSHGDFVRWNLMTLNDHRVAVVDFERTGVRPVFFDAVYGMTQEDALKGRSPDLSGLQARLSNCRLGAAPVAEVLIRGLLCGLLEALRDWVNFPDNRRRTESLFMAKHASLKSIGVV